MVVPKTYSDIYLNLRRRLREAGIAAFELEARELVAFATSKTKEQFFRDKMLYAGDESLRQIEALALRRLAGEPVAYLIGEWEFYGLPLDISRDVLVPRADSEVLAGRAIELTQAVKIRPAKVLDLCCGSGCIGLAIAAHVPTAKVTLCDISEEALRISRQNIRRNGLVGQVITLAGNALEAPPSVLWECDVIACNPPYIRSDEMQELEDGVRLYEPRLALDGGADGLDFYRAVAEKWKRNLKVGGHLLFEVGHTQAGQVEMILAQFSYQVGDTLTDTGGHFRVVHGIRTEA